MASTNSDTRSPDFNAVPQLSGHLVNKQPQSLSRQFLEEVGLDDPIVGVTQMSRQGQNIQPAQDTIFNFLLDIVKKWPPEEVLLEFKRLFLYSVDSVEPTVVDAVYEIVFSNNETEFRNTIKRCCYILVNNWDAGRHYKPIQELVQAFLTLRYTEGTTSHTLKRLRAWIEQFTDSQDYEELKLFAERYDEPQSRPWASRYTTYLLVPQFIDSRNPIEQREAARALSKQLRDRFKFDLAMYIARSQTPSVPERIPRNPTALGDDVLRLIKTIVAKRGPFSHASLANIFLDQIQCLNYQEFKQSLLKYLIFSVDHNDYVETLRSKLAERLELLYEDYSDSAVNDALILRSCNRVIEYLTSENRQEPSPLFVFLLSQGNPMTLVVILLKLILICKNSRTHLESRIADLIKYYEDFPEDECNWVVNFLEIFNVTFAIYAENVEYNLIKMQVDEERPPHIDKLLPDLDAYRIFSQLKRHSIRLEAIETEDGELEDAPIAPPPEDLPLTY
jgi:hypothetical protein